MIVSTKGRYALHIMTELAQSDDFRSLKQIATVQHIPYKYAENIVALLMKAEFVTASRGKNGGYRLTRRPEQYTIAEILTAVETTLTASGCSEIDSGCPHSATCPTLPIWKKLDETVQNFLSQYTLADLRISNTTS